MKLTKLDKASIIAIRDCMGTQTNESILIITDEFKRKLATHFSKMPNGSVMILFLLR